MLFTKQYKKRQKEDEQATAYEFQEFIATFQDIPNIPTKTFVKSTTLYPDNNQNNFETREIYNPKPFNSTTIKNEIECARIIKNDNNYKQNKAISNLESIKEELKSVHTERQQQTKQITQIEKDNSSTTNLFISSLHYKLTSDDLIELFGYFGPLASVKIICPTMSIASNKGFVAFMARTDAERALKHMQGRSDIRVYWAKPIEIPIYPIYIPPFLTQFLPPPPTNLPFNAQPFEFEIPKCEEDLEKSTVKVVIPMMDLKILRTIHRMIEFVIREGPMFEAFIMNKEVNNPTYKFLFDNRCSEHIYYRWKLFSILHGDELDSWSMKPFRMYVGGSVWLPPEKPKFQEGMPEDLFLSKKHLSESQNNRLMHLIRTLSLERCKIAEVMMFCIEHCEAIDDIIYLILDSMKNFDTHPLKKLARLFLLSDVLHNVKNRQILKEKHFEDMTVIFKSLHCIYKRMKYPLDKENFELRVIKILRFWNVHNYLSDDLIKKLECNFMYNSDSIVTSDSVDEIVEETDTDDNAMYSYFVPSKWDTIDANEVETEIVSTETIKIKRRKLNGTDLSRQALSLETEIFREKKRK